jgi:hypothetical protein
LGDIVREKFPGVKFQSLALEVLQEAAEAWGHCYQGAGSADEKKKIVLEHRFYK